MSGTGMGEAVAGGGLPLGVQLSVLCFRTRNVFSEPREVCTVAVDIPPDASTHTPLSSLAEVLPCACSGVWECLLVIQGNS